MQISLTFSPQTNGKRHEKGTINNNCNYIMSKSESRQERFLLTNDNFTFRLEYEKNGIIVGIIDPYLILSFMVNGNCTNSK